MPSVSSFYISRQLTGVAAAYAPGNLIAASVMPVVPSALQKGKIYNIDPDRRFLIARDNNRAPGAEPSVLDYDAPTTTDYDATDHSLTGFVADELVQQADAEARPAIATVERLVQNILLKREIDLVASLSSVTQTSSPSTKWNDPGGDIFADLKAQFGTVRTGCGMLPNALALDEEVLRKASESPAWQERVRYTMNPGEVGTIGNAAILADAIGLPRGNVFVASGNKNGAIQGQSASISSIWGENVLLFYKEDPRSAGMGSPNFGIHVTWNGSDGVGQGGFLVETERIARRKGDAVYVHHYYDQVLMNANAAYLFTNTLT